MIIGTLMDGTKCVYDLPIKVVPLSNSKVLFTTTTTAEWQKVNARSFTTSLNY